MTQPTSDKTASPYSTRIVADIVKINGPLAGKLIRDGYNVPCVASGVDELIHWIDVSHMTNKVIRTACGDDYRFASLAREVSP